MTQRLFLLPLLLLCYLPFPALAVDQYTVKVLEKKPHDRANYVQGLEIHDGLLYVSAGEYGKSRLLRYHLDTMALQVERRLNPRLFAEGLTVFGEHIYQLTWRERMMLVFSRDEMKVLEWYPIPGLGWGLTNNGNELIYTDGSDRLMFIDPAKRTTVRTVAVTENDRPLGHINELEWIDGKIWANVYQTDRIVIIDPDSGVVEASIDLSGLLPAVERRPDTNVLNGIARNPADGAIWVTGKKWPWLYRIELVSADDAPLATNSR